MIDTWLTEGRKSRVNGMDLQDYVAWVMFVDAFVQLAKDDYPEIYKNVQSDEKKLVVSVKNLLRRSKLDPEKYLAKNTAKKMMNNLSKLWDKKFDLYDVLNWDDSTIGSIVLQSRGHGTTAADDTRFAKFLEKQGLKVPEVSDYGVELDESPYIGAMKALEDLSKDLTESIDLRRVNAKKNAIRAIVELIRFYPKNDLDRVLYELENL